MDFGLTHHLTRADEELVAKCSQEKAFLSGGNSSCRYYAHQHYELYKKLCKEANIPEYHWAIPQDIWMEMEALKNRTQSGRQINLDGVVQKEHGPREFTQAVLQHTITQFVACDNQVSNHHTSIVTQE